MGSVNSIPVVSQLRSLCQVCCGDANGALATQEHFSRTCILIAPTRAIVELSMGRVDDAEETAHMSNRALMDFGEGILNNVPVIGHIKGAIHYACNDKKGGDRSMKSASRPVGTIAGGVGGFFVGGPVGAVAGGIYGGLCMDTVISGSDLAVNGDEAEGSGYFTALKQAVDASDPGGIFDGVFGVVATAIGDAATGYAAGKAVQTVRDRVPSSRLEKGLEGTTSDPATTAKNLTEQANDLNKAVEGGEFSSNKQTTTSTLTSNDTGQVIAQDVNKHATTHAIKGGDQTLTTGQAKVIMNRQQQSLQAVNNGQPPFPVAPDTTVPIQPPNPACAEYRAGLNALRRSGGQVLSPDNITTSTIRWEAGAITACGRCQSCQTFNMGYVPTDHISGMAIPTAYTSAGNVASGVAVAAGVSMIPIVRVRVRAEAQEASGTE
eukprot:GHVU01161244.1.p1 GENE.GHVU01161244.1~~GHVU01161244.1.p1  ORF type:complete len:435 (-),score=28.30 GHVU01161244.1:1526-2830(-)